MHLIAGLLNFLTAGMWVLMLLWLCIGVLWLLPMGLSLWQAYVGYEMQAGRRAAPAETMGIVGLVTSIVNFNVFAIALSAFAMMKTREPEVAGFLSVQR